MPETILVRGARQLLTLQGPPGPRRAAAHRELGIIRDGALLIQDGRILEVGPSRRVENLAQARTSIEIDATGRLVMPGFVDCHTHLVSGGLRLESSETQPSHNAQNGETAAHDTASHSGELHNASAKRLEWRARQFVHSMARHGTTALEARSGYGLPDKDELKILRALGKLRRMPLDVQSTFFVSDLPPAYARDPSAYLMQICAEVLPAIWRKSLAPFAGIRCDGDVFDLERSRRYLETARDMGFRLKIDASGLLPREVVRLAVETGVVTVDHLSTGSPADFEPLARSHCLAVLLPALACHENGSPQIARTLIDGGAAVAIATNFHVAGCPTYSMQTIVGMACRQLGLTPAEAICAGTYNAACAIGMEQTVGSLESKKSADLIVMNVADYREIPHYFGVNLVNRTIKRGVTIYQEGKVTARSGPSSNPRPAEP